MAVAGEDESPEAAFKNVPRRRRSTARPPKEEEEELGGDAAPGRGAPPPEAPPAARDKKRPSSDRGGAETHFPRAEKRHRPLHAEDAAKNGAGAAAAASSGRERPADWAEKERIRKGKMPASPPRMSAYDDDDDASAPRRPSEPGGGKLMGDAMRSHGGTKNKPPKSKKRKDRGAPFWYGMGREGQPTSAAGSDADHSFFKMGAVVSDMLRATLANLGVDAAAAPERVYGRLLSRCDRNTHQSRLQMSCKSWRADRGEYPLCAFLTEAERKEAHGDGLKVAAYDRRGEKYKITIRYLRSNRSYRLTKSWGDFLRGNGLVVVNGGDSNGEPGEEHVMLDLWLFRPPGGEVGMVILHYFKGDAAHADAALEEEEDRTARSIRSGGNDDATAAEASSPLEPDAAMEEEDDAGVKGEAVAAPSPSSEPDSGAKREEQAGGAPSEVAAGLSSSLDADGTKAEEKDASGAPVEASPEAGGGAAKVEKEEAEAGGGTRTAEEKEASAAAPMDAVAVQSSSSDAGGAAKAADLAAGALGGEEAAQAPLPPDDGAGGAKKATFMFGVTKYDVLAAQTLLMLSQGFA